MPRLMSFSMTVDAIVARQKTVTRRRGWAFLKPGDVVTAVVKSQGLAKGEKVKRLGDLRIVSNEPVFLCGRYDENEARREGFPGWTWRQFVDHFLATIGGEPRQIVQRIEFEYLDLAIDRGVLADWARRKYRERYPSAVACVEIIETYASHRRRHDVEFDRVSGLVICERCDRPLYDHPPHPFCPDLSVLCNGRVVKL